jgi:hypothetical protein
MSEVLKDIIVNLHHIIKTCVIFYVTQTKVLNFNNLISYKIPFQCSTLTTSYSLHSYST